MKSRGFSTSAARGIRDKQIADYLREDLSDQIEQDEFWESLGYGWTSDFALDVLQMTNTQTNTFLARIAQLTLGNVIALWATFGHEECRHGPFDIFGALWDRLNQGQALAILAISGLEIGAIFNLAQFCEDVLTQKPYPSNPESVENRAHKKMIIMIERVKEHL